MDNTDQNFRIFANHQSVSALGYTFLTETVIYLMALHFGANNIQLGFISGTLYLAGIGLFLLPRFIEGHRLRRVYLLFWTLRGIICLTYLALPFLSGQTAVWLILITYTLFCLFRVFGMAAQQPLVKTLLKPETEGKQLSLLNLRFNLSSLISRGLSFALLSIPLLAGLPGYLLLIAIGILLNTGSAAVAASIKNEERIIFGESRSLLKHLSNGLKNEAARPALLMQWLFVAGSVFSAFVFPWLKQIALLSPGMIFLYSLAAGAGAIVGNFFLGTLIDRTGTRPLAFLVTVPGALLYLVWSFLPAELPAPILLLPGLLSGFLMSTGYNVTNRQIYGVLPEADRVGFSAMNAFVSAMTALGAGLAGGFLADLGKTFTLPAAHSYSWPLLAVTLSLSGAAVIALVSPAGKSLSIRNTARLMFNLRKGENVGMK